jgi:transketolase
MKTDEFAHLKKISVAVRRAIVRMHARSNSSHVGSALSCVDLLVALFFEAMYIWPDRPEDVNRDRFILSKGHAVSSLYTTLAMRGFFPEGILDEYCANGGRLPGHAKAGCVAGVEVSTGSLGHGLSIGLGMALAAKLDNRRHKIYVLLSDGECDEGSVWEAALFANHHHLDNVVGIIDYNKLQAFGWTNMVLNLEPLAEKWKAFGWSVKQINGHDFGEILSALDVVPFRDGRPSMIIAHTVKGKGISFMEGQLAWHYKSPNENELEVALQELA